MLGGQHARDELGPTTASIDAALTGGCSEDPVAAAESPEGQEFSHRSVLAWRAVVEESGTATAEEIAAATEVSLAQFAPGRTG